jgi:hypothetical protein
MPQRICSQHEWVDKTKIVGVCDAAGRLVDFLLALGQAHGLAPSLTLLRRTADLSCKLPWRQLPEQHFPPISEGAAHQRPALDGPSSSLGSRAVRGGFGPLKDSSALWHG